MATGLQTRLAAVRQARGVTQAELAARAGTTRQSLHALETGRSVPSTRAALRLARALECRVEDLFALDEPGAVAAEVAGRARAGGRAALVRLAGRWVAHPLAADDPTAADALVAGAGRVNLLRPAHELEDQVAVAGCAPALGLLAGRAGVVWLERSTGAALDLLARDRVHVAGAHGEHERPALRRPAIIVRLARWEAGLAVAPGARRLRRVADLARPGLRVAHREAGAAAETLLERALAGAPRPRGPLARGHMDVARIVALGAADCGVTIRSAALAHRLPFLPLADERFDLVVPRELAALAPVARLLDALAGAAFRRELASLGGYDTRDAGAIVGEVTA